MKLQNIILALCAVIAFTACSTDDNPYGDAKAKLTVKVSTKGTATKADTNELPGEANINTLVAFVFDPADGSVQGVHSTAPNTSHECGMSGIPSNKLGVMQLLLVANAPSSITSASSYQGLEAMLAELSAQEQSNLMMSSPVLSTPSLVEGENVISGTIVLTRLPARIQIGTVATRFEKNPLLIGRRVMVTNVYIENVKAKSHYFSVADWGKVQISDNFMTSAKVPFTKYTPQTELGYAAYVMENLGIDEGKYTSIVVDATLEQSGQLTPIRKLFRAVINANGILKGADHNYVKRNYVYNVGITFTDTSFDPDEPQDPDEPEPPLPVDGQLDVTVTVVDWGQIYQPVDVN